MTAEIVPVTTRKINLKLPKDLRKRFRDLFLHGLAQIRLYKKFYPGIMHIMIFSGVTIQLIGTAINLMQMALFIPFVELPFPRGNAYFAYELIMDLAGLAILIGVSMAAIRRGLVRPKTLETRWDDIYALALLAIIPLMGFTTESFRLYTTAPAWAIWSPIGNLLAEFWRSINLSQNFAVTLHPFLVGIHAALGLIFIASIPFTKLRHLVFIPSNIFFRSIRNESSLEKIEDIEEAETLGVGQVSEFTPNQLLMLEACVNCGRCEEVCPSSISGMPYSPRKLIQNLREIMVNSMIPHNGLSSSEVFGKSIEEAFPWYCTTCGACIKSCPALINQVDEVIDLRRYQVLTTGEVQKSIGDVLRNVERQGNPWGMPAEDRMVWAEGLDIHQLSPGDETDVLLFLGCAFAYDDRNKKVAESFVKLLKKANVDFAVLGLDESCCGDTARRMGHEYLFQVLAEQNIDAFSKVKFNRIVTQCPHCFNTLKNEYPQMGGDYKVQHYSEYLSENIDSWKQISANGHSSKEKYIFHDSCYLGRYNNIYQQPRKLLDWADVNSCEFSRNGENSFCCGGGGGQMWMETDAETRINHRRLDEALDKKAEIITTACPYCLLMFDDAIRSKGLSEQIEVMDIAEILIKKVNE